MLFGKEHFLLRNEESIRIYEEFCQRLPIIDYHCHLKADEIYKDKKFNNITELWLSKDHYKWRLMRANGIDEERITGLASDRDKFFAWAETIERCPGNPLYHWAHMELAVFFGITCPLNQKNAAFIWNEVNQQLGTNGLGAQAFIKKSNVKFIGTTDHPLSDLEYHKKLMSANLPFTVVPTFRIDNILDVENKSWFDEIDRVYQLSFNSIGDYLGFIKKRIDYFAQLGCRSADLGVGSLYWTSISSEIFIRLLDNKKLVVKMPEGVPPAVGKSFEALFPSMITLAIFGIVPLICAFVGIQDIVTSFYEIIQRPFMGLSNNIGAAIIIPFFIQILWFFGLHGGNVLAPFMETINAPAIEANISAIANGQTAPYLINKPFMTAFVHLGGSGATIGLIIAILLLARQVKSLRAVSGLSAPAAVFNINEPMIFGFPIVLNPILFVPFVIGPVILCVVAYLATRTGLIPAATFVVPWNIPPIIGGVLATQSWRGGVLAAFNLILSIVIYLPFVKFIAVQEMAKEKTAEKRS